MKKIFTVFFALAFAFSVTGCKCGRVEPIKLEEAQYGEGKIEYLETYDIIQNKFNNDINFVFYMYGATCSGCHKFTPILKEYVEEAGINIYAIEVNQVLKGNPELAQTLEGTPSIGLVKEGELHTFISGYVDGDADYFMDKEALKEWFEENIIFE